MTPSAQLAPHAAIDRRLSVLGFLVMFLVGTDTFIVAPLLPTLASSYGVTVARAGWLVSGYALGYAITALFAGPVSDRHNRRVVLGVGMTVFALATLLCATAASFWIMFAYRFVAGAAAAIASPQVWAAIPAVATPTRILHVLGYATAGLSIAQVVGVPAGSWMATVSWRTPFIVVGVASAILTVVLFLRFPDVRPADTGTPRVTYRALFSQPGALWRFGSYFAYMLAFFTVFTYAPAWLAIRRHAPLPNIALVILVAGLGNMLGSLFGSRLTSKTTLTRSMLIGALIMTVAYALLWTAPNVVLITLALFIIFICGGSLLSVRMLHLQQLRPDARGTISSLTSGIMYLATTAAGIVGGPLLRATPNFSAIAVTAAALSLLSGLMIVCRQHAPVR